MAKFPIEEISMKDYIYCSFFAFSNHLQLLGDRQNSEVSTKQALVLAAIALFEDFELNLKDTAEMVGTSSQNVKKIINILERKGYAVTKKDEHDARVMRIALTEKGKNFHKYEVTESKAVLEKLFDGFDDERISRLYHDLRDLMDNILKSEGSNHNGDLHE